MLYLSVSRELMVSDGTFGIRKSIIESVLLMKSARILPANMGFIFLRPGEDDPMVLCQIRIAFGPTSGRIRNDGTQLSRDTMRSRAFDANDAPNFNGVAPLDTEHAVSYVSQLTSGMTFCERRRIICRMSS